MTASSRPPIEYELNRLFQIKTGGGLLKENDGAEFPWLLDTLRFGKIPTSWTAEQRIAVMNHLLRLISTIEEAEGQDLEGIRYAWYCFQAGHDYHSQDYDFSPVIERLKTTSDVHAIVWLINCLEYTYSKKVFSKYVKPFFHHSDEDVVSTVEEAETRMKF